MTATTNAKEKDLTDIVACNLERLEPGLTVFDTRVPTVLGHEIDILALDKIKRLTLVAIWPKKVPGRQVVKEILALFYRWNFISDFKEDLWAAADEREVTLALRPPRIILLTPELPPTAWPYLNWMRECHIKISVFSLDEPAPANGKEPDWQKVEWPEKIKPLSRALLHKFNLDNVKIVNEQRIVWEALIAQDPLLNGYSKDRRLAAARKEMFGKGKEGK